MYVLYIVYTTPSNISTLKNLLSKWDRKYLVGPEPSPGSSVPVCIHTTNAGLWQITINETQLNSQSRYCINHCESLWRTEMGNLINNLIEMNVLRKTWKLRRWNTTNNLRLSKQRTFYISVLVSDFNKLSEC